MEVQGEMKSPIRCVSVLFSEPKIPQLV